MAPIYGVEYQLDGGSPLPALHDYNVPCAVCHVSTRVAVLMIPAWRHCPSQWTMEYTGYLMTELPQYLIIILSLTDSSQTLSAGLSMLMFPTII